MCLLEDLNQSHWLCRHPCDPMFWTRGSGKEDFYKLSIYFYYFPIISPLGRAWPFIWTNLNPLHPGILCAKFGWNWSSGSGEEDENVKSLQTYGQTNGQTDDGWQVIRKAHLSFQLRWAKNITRIFKLIFKRNMYVEIGSLE